MQRPSDMLAAQIEIARLPTPRRGMLFAPPRKWRAQFAWPKYRVMLEIRQRELKAIWEHDRLDRDCTRYSAAALLGWRLLLVTPKHVESGRALEWVARALLQAQEGAWPMIQLQRGKSGERVIDKIAS